MKYPKEVQKYIDSLSVYKENDVLDKFDIIHLYPGELAYPNGYWDSRFFTLVGFDTEKKQKRIIKMRDEIAPDIDVKSLPLVKARIFADGSTLLKFDPPIMLKICGQSVLFG